MLYQDKSLEELRDIVGTYRQAQLDIFGEFDEDEFIQKINDLIERLKQKRFESVFQTMNPATLKTIPNIIKNTLQDYDNIEPNKAETPKANSIKVASPESRAQESKGKKRKQSK